MLMGKYAKLDLYVRRSLVKKKKKIFGQVRALRALRALRAPRALRASRASRASRALRARSGRN